MSDHSPQGLKGKCEHELVLLNRMAVTHRGQLPVAVGYVTEPGPRSRAQRRLRELLEYAIRLPFAEREPPITVAQVNEVKDTATAMVLVKRLYHWADSLLAENRNRQPLSTNESKAAPRKKVSKAAAVETLLGDDGKKALEIARSDQSADDKMRAICAIDPNRFLQWDSPQWADLLDVTDAAIRKTPFWRKDRPKALERLQGE
jgi:hypothetical protein